MTHSRLRRTLAIFRLALSFWGDSRRLSKAKRHQSAEAFKKVEESVYRRGGARFRQEALRLGGLIIKVGQFLSARTDILPLGFTRELAALQDQVPAADWDAVKALLEEQYQGPLKDIFSRFESEPVAAASLGQVHRATLREQGLVVAVKVQRPGIWDLARTDLSALKIIMAVFERYTKAGQRINASRLLEEFQGMVERELDYVREESNLRHFRENFGGVPSVVIPRSYPELTRTRAFVMEYVEGVKLTDTEGLLERGINAKALAQILIAAFLKQLIVDGFVQIDPHAGNFLADAEGRVIFLDFGMMSTIPTRDLGHAARLLQGVLLADAALVVEAAEGLGFVKTHASKPLLLRAVRVMLGQFQGTPLEPGPGLEAAVAEFQDFLYQEPLEFPAQYMFLGRAIGMLFGLVSALDSGIDWLALLKDEALPLLNRRSDQNNPAWLQSAADWTERVFGGQARTLVSLAGSWGWETGRELVRMPGTLSRVLEQVQNGALATQPELTQVLRRLDRLGDLAEAGFDLLMAALLGSGLWALYASRLHLQWLLWILGVLAAYFLARAILGRRRSRRRLGRGRHG